jgi:hypothetical protein
LSDNTQLNKGYQGDLIATDDIGGVKHQRVKLIHGLDGVNDGDVATTNPLPVILRDASGNAVYVDSYAKALGVISHDHLQIHRSVTYTISEQITVDDSGGATPVAYYLLTVPASTYPHLRTISTSSDGGPYTVELFESPTTTANGTAKTAHNNDRNSSNTSGTTVYTGPTVSADGTLLESVLAPSTRGSAGFDSTEEWILKASTNYLIKITNNTSGAGTSEFAITFAWYEG